MGVDGVQGDTRAVHRIGWNVEGRETGQVLAGQSDGGEWEGGEETGELCTQRGAERDGGEETEELCTERRSEGR